MKKLKRRNADEVFGLQKEITLLKKDLASILDKEKVVREKLKEVEKECVIFFGKKLKKKLKLESVSYLYDEYSETHVLLQNRVSDDFNEEECIIIDEIFIEMDIVGVINVTFLYDDGYYERYHDYKRIDI